MVVMKVVMFSNLIEVTLKRYGRIDYIINNAALQLSVQPFLQVWP